MSGPASPMPMPGAASAGMSDPTAGTAPDAGQDADDAVVCTICSDGQGGFVVYSGDEPEGGGDTADLSEDDADAMAPGGGDAGAQGAAEPSPQGQPAASIGEALKIVMTILQQSESAGGGSAGDQFASGFGASKSPTPASGGGRAAMAQKF